MKRVVGRKWLAGFPRVCPPRAYRGEAGLYQNNQITLDGAIYGAYVLRRAESGLPTLIIAPFRPALRA